MTTDTHPKEGAVAFECSGKTVTIGGIAKGAGMIHPNMATMLTFITTDADMEGQFLQRALSRAADSSFNMLTVDGDSSTNDTVLLLANGAADAGIIEEGTEAGNLFQEALNRLCIHLTKELARTRREPAIASSKLPLRVRLTSLPPALLPGRWRRLAW